MEEEVFYPFKEKVRLIRILFSTFLIVVGYFVFFKPKSFYYWYIYAFFFLISGVLFLFNNLKSYFGKTPGIYLNQNSLFVKSSASTINIKWKEIKSFQSFDKGAYLFISVILYDDKAFLQKKNFYEKWVRKRALKNYDTLVPICVNFYNVSRTVLLAELNYRLEKYR